MSTNYVYTPTSSNINDQLDTLIQFAEIGNKLKEELKGNVTTERLNQILTDTTNSANKELVEQYNILKQKFEKMEKVFLVEAARTLGFEEREFLIKPLKDLVDKIKTLEVTPQYAVQQIVKLVKTMGINKILNNTEAIPYVGEVAAAFMKNLDNFTQAQPVMEKIVKLLVALGVDQKDVRFIDVYSKDNFVTSSYKSLQRNFAEGEFIHFPSPFTYVKNTVGSFAVKLKNTIYYFFNAPPSSSQPAPTPSSSQPAPAPEPAPTPTPTPTPPEPEPTTTVIENNEKKSDGMVGGGHIHSSHRKNKKTKREIYNINKTIKSYLLRLKSPVRKPLRKSVASRKIKRRF